MTETQTFNTLKYLPVQLTEEYFQGLPDEVAEQMINWLLKNAGSNLTRKAITERDKTNLYNFLTNSFAGPDTYNEMIRQLEYYIKHHVES